MAHNLIIAGSLEEAVRSKGPSSAFYAGGTEIGRLNSPVDAETLILLKKIPEMMGICRRDDFDPENGWREFPASQKTGDGAGPADAAADTGKAAFSEEGSWVRLGGLCTFQEALESELLPDYFRKALRNLASLPRRYKATVGGNVAAFRSDSYLLPVLLASGSGLEIACAAKDSCGYCLKMLSMEEYLENRELYADCLITALYVNASKDLKLEEKRFSNTAQSHAYLSLAMGREGDRTRIGMAVLGCGVWSPGVLSWSISWKKAGVKDDMYGSEAYKRYLTGITLDDFYEKLHPEMEKGGGVS